MALGSSWPSSPSTTHFQLHVIAMLCLARCLCGHEIQQFRDFIWWEKQILHPPPCSQFGCGGSFASTAQDSSPGTERPLEEPWSAPVIAPWKHRSLHSTHNISPEPEMLFQLLPPGIRGVLVLVWSIYLSCVPFLFFQDNILRDEHTLKMEKQDVPS